MAQIWTWCVASMQKKTQYLSFTSDCLFDLSIEVELRKKKMALAAVLTFCQSGLKVWGINPREDKENIGNHALSLNSLHRVLDVSAGRFPEYNTIDFKCHIPHFFKGCKLLREPYIESVDGSCNWHPSVNIAPFCPFWETERIPNVLVAYHSMKLRWNGCLIHGNHWTMVRWFLYHAL